MKYLKYVAFAYIGFQLANVINTIGKTFPSDTFTAWNGLTVVVSMFIFAIVGGILAHKD